MNTIDRLNTILQVTDQNNLARIAYDKFKSITPIKTGQARQNTQLVGNKIVADYQYAEVLDLGRHMSDRGMRGSEQAPEGMTKPTVEYVNQYVKDQLK